MYLHLKIFLLVAAAVLPRLVLPIELAFFAQMKTGSHLYIGQGALLYNISRDFAHGGCSSLAQIQPVDWIPRGINASFEGLLSMLWLPFAAF